MIVFAAGATQKLRLIASCSTQFEKNNSNIYEKIDFNNHYIFKFFLC